MRVLYCFIKPPDAAIAHRVDVLVNEGFQDNGDRKGKVGNLLSVWNDAAPGHTFDDWLEVDFNGSKTIGEIDVFTIQDNWQNPSDPTEAMTFSNYGITSYDVQYWNGSSWATVSGGSVTANNKVWRKFTFAAVTTTKVRALVHASGDGYSRVAELEAWTASTAQLHWLVADQLGTPRMVFDQSGDLTVTNQNGQYVSGATRHDYLPFGEELAAGTGGRTTAQGYSASDGIRQRWTGKEQDNESGLDYFIHRYYSSMQGRFTSVDPENTGADPENPQSWNGYAHTLNNPITNTDPDGLKVRICGTDGACTDDKTDLSDEEFNKYFRDAKGIKLKDGNVYQNGNLIGTYQRLSFDDLNDFANGVIFGRGNQAGLVQRLPPVQKVAEWGFAIDSALIGGLTTIGPVGGATLTLGSEGAVTAAVGLTTKAAAREAIERMAASPAAKAAAKRAISRATTSSTINVVQEGSSIIVRIQRAGHDGYQVIESVIKSDGTKAVVQKAYDAAGKLVHYDPK